MFRSTRAALQIRCDVRTVTPASRAEKSAVILIPTSSTLVGASIKPGEQVVSSANFHLTASSAEVIAVGWAGGLKDRDKFEPYPNSLTILGGGVAGGFYDATYVRPTSIQRINGPVPYYLVQMRGNVAGTTQTLYAVVLDDGRVVRPVPAS